MLERPEYGWSRVTIGDWSDRCGYLDDVPFLLLEALEQICRTTKPSAVRLDAEGWEYLIVFNLCETHIITETDDGYALHTVESTPDKLAQELVSDIKENLCQWAEWPDYGDMSDDEKEERAKDLSVLCGIVEQRLASWPFIHKAISNKDTEV